MWYGDESVRVYHNHVPTHERQSIGRGELHRVPQALMRRQAKSCPSYSWRRDCINLGYLHSLDKGGSYSFAAYLSHQVSINATPQLIQQASTIASLAGQMDPPKVFDSPQTGRPQVLIDLAFFRALLETVSQIHSQMLETPKVGFNLTGANFNRNY